MKRSLKQTRRAGRVRPEPTARAVLYLYGISQARRGGQIAMEARSVDGNSGVEAMPAEGYVCWFSKVDRTEYADELARNMEQLDWLAAASVRHQRALDELASKLELVPARFGTVFLDEASLRKHVVEQKPRLRALFRRIHGALEWGVKVFREERAVSSAVTTAASGREYLQRKAEATRPRRGKEVPELKAFRQELEKLSVETAPGGKASSGQPGLEWHGSYLIRKAAQPKLMTILKKYSSMLAGEYRIECSGPWPAYSFVDTDGR